MSNEEYEPIKVHIASTAVPVPQLAPKARQKRTVCNTVVLTSNEPVQEILPKSESRCSAYIQALDNDIVLVTSLSQGMAKSNTVASVPFPSGTYVFKANTAPWPVDGNDLVFAAATTTSSNSRVSVISTYYVED